MNLQTVSFLLFSKFCASKSRVSTDAVYTRTFTVHPINYCYQIFLIHFSIIRIIYLLINKYRHLFDLPVFCSILKCRNQGITTSNLVYLAKLKSTIMKTDQLTSLPTAFKFCSMMSTQDNPSSTTLTTRPMSS